MAAKPPDENISVTLERFREAYNRVVADTGASASVMAVALGRSVKTLDNWRASPPRVSDIPFGAVVRMSRLAGLPLEWFAGGAASPNAALEAGAAAVAGTATNAEVLAEFAGLRRMLERRLEVALGPEAALDAIANPAPKPPKGRRAPSTRPKRANG